jgi:hypothetical protein
VLSLGCTLQAQAQPWPASTIRRTSFFAFSTPPYDFVQDAVFLSLLQISPFSPSQALLGDDLVFLKRSNHSMRTIMVQ